MLSLLSLYLSDLHDGKTEFSVSIHILSITCCCRPEKKGDVPPGLPEKEAVGLKKKGDVPPGLPEKEAVGLKKQGDVPPGLPEKEAVGLKKQGDGDVPPGLPEKKAVGLKKSFNNEDLLEVPVVTMSKVISDQPPPKTQRITFHSPVLQAVYPITPDNETQTRKAEEDRKPLYPRVLSSTPTCGCVPAPVPVQPGLLEPFTGFKEHLCRQLLHSPTPLAQLLEKIMSQVPQVHTLQTPCSTLPAHTVQLSGSQGPGGALPRITMTRPTPSPKLPLLQSHNKNRHAA
uniref:Uncharacterized protein n=1 Tax=Salmo trutta TaxID=8032 RepID=A0A673ZPL2_SALTR